MRVLALDTTTRAGSAAMVEDDRVVDERGGAASTLARWRRQMGEERVDVMGDGAVLFADVIAREAPTWGVAPAPLLAGAIGGIALARARRGETVDAAGLHPLYIRRPDAEVARDRRAD